VLAHAAACVWWYVEYRKHGVLSLFFVFLITH
jgi:hypothetical protein